MPLQKLQFRPGVNREGTDYSNEGGWFQCDKVRFRSGYPEKIGGWTQATPGSNYLGVCRAMVNWVDLNNNNLIGVGTNLKYYINRGLGVYNDVTPIRMVHTNLNNPFTTVTGSSTLQFTDAGNLAQVGDFVTFSGATGFNGLSASILNAEFRITDILDGSTYEVQLPAGTLPTASGSGGGDTVTATYQISVGLPAYTLGNGWGAGVWNGANVNNLFNTTLTYTSGPTPWVLLNATSTTINVVSTAQFPPSGAIRIDAEIITYTGLTATSFTGCIRGTNGSSAAVHGYRPTAGTPEPVTVYSVLGYYGVTGWGDASAGAGVGVGQQMRVWSNDNYGQDLLIAPRGGPIYYWGNNTSTWPRAVPLTGLSDNAPTATNQVIVSDVSRFAIAMGANSYGDPFNTFDPMLVRWSDQENPFVWTPAITNQAGEQRLSNGSYIVQAEKNRQEILIWTDAAIYSMQFLGPPYVFGFQLLMDNISIMGPNAAIVVNNVAYWMGVDKFYSYSGVVQTLPCALRQYVFDDISFDQRYQTVAGANEGYNEVWWFYVSQTEVNLATEEGRVPLVDRYVVYNHLEKVWYYGTMRRTYWLDSGLQQFPMGAFGDVNQGTILFHENGNDDASTATPVPFDAYISSSDFDLGDGYNFGFVWRIIPDVNFTGSNGGFPQVYMQLLPREFSGSPYGKTATTDTKSTQPYSPIVNQYIIQQYTQQVYSRVRGRQMRLTVGSSGQLGVAWQLGTPRIDIKPDGRR